MEKILIGFQLGLLIALISYIVSAITGRKTAAIKPNLLIVASLILLIYQMPFVIHSQQGDGSISLSLFSLVKLIAASMVLAVLVAYVLSTIAEIYNATAAKPLHARTVEVTKQILYGASLFGPLVIILLAPYQATIVVYEVLKNSILITLGLWGALKLFWSTQHTASLR